MVILKEPKHTRRFVEVLITTVHTVRRVGLVVHQSVAVVLTLGVHLGFVGSLRVITQRLVLTLQGSQLLGVAVPQPLRGAHGEVGQLAQARAHHDLGNAGGSRLNVLRDSLGCVGACTGHERPL